ncbi:MAG: ADP-ribosylglycohydrolase family protein [Natronincolaceae bacterium]|nr:ADP-ribosylglycohydrolase family protein [Bacillota bacterium]NLK90109.1 hypothetical protein [Clostridiales bacterium]
MEGSKKNVDMLPYMAYGDALGFLKENSNGHDCLQSFSYLYDQDLEFEMQKGQWSYITQLALINCKCFIDNKKENRVLIDYMRMAEEIKLWQYYRCGTPVNYINKLDSGRDYYTSDFYWEDKRGEAFTRIIPIVLVNKNFIAAQEEVYKNIIYINRHPQVILTGLLLLRTIYLLMNNTAIEKEELVNGLKDYLINLQLSKLEQDLKGQMSLNYKIQFEQEKINYLIALDRIKVADLYIADLSCSKDIFLLALINFFKLYKGETIIKPPQQEQKEVYTIMYALLALVEQTDKVKTDEIKDSIFIKSMNEYLFKLREYEIGREFFKNENRGINLFTLQKGTTLKHPILNNIMIKDRLQSENCIELTVMSKTGEYKFLKRI